MYNNNKIISNSKCTYYHYYYVEWAAGLQSVFGNRTSLPTNQ